MSELVLMTKDLPVEKALIGIDAPMESLLGLDAEGYAVVMSDEVHRRIVACVNACLGIDTPWLEARNGGLLGEMFQDCKRERDEARAMVKELAKVLTDLSTNPHLNLGDLVYDVREREGLGWDGPSVVSWGETVAKIKPVLAKAEAINA